MEATGPEDAGYTVDFDPVEGALLVVALRGARPRRRPAPGHRPVDGDRRRRARVLLDLTEVDFIDSTALGAIMHASTEAEATGKSMLVVALDGPVRRLLEITNLTGRFRVYPSRDEALAAAAA